MPAAKAELLPLPLTRAEEAELAEDESVIEQHLGTFFEVGARLAHIRDNRLYRNTHDSFEAYCKDRWDIGKSNANHLVRAAEVHRELAAAQDKSTPPADKRSAQKGTAVPTKGALPRSAYQARPLAPLLKDPPKLRQAWDKAVEQFGPEPTQDQVKDVVDQLTSAPVAVAETPAAQGKAHAPRPGVTKWSKAVQRISATVPMTELSDDEVTELHGAVRYLFAYCVGALVLRGKLDEGDTNSVR